MKQSSDVRKRLKFAHRPRNLAIEAAEDGDFAATVRFGDEKDIQAGDELSLRDTDGAEFGTGRVISAAECKAWDAIGTIDRAGARYGAATESRLLGILNEHYDDTIWPETTVKVVVFKPTLTD